MNSDSSSETTVQICCPECEKVVAEPPVEPDGGLWACDDCSIAFDLSGEQHPEGWVVTDDTDLAAAKRIEERDSDA